LIEGRMIELQAFGSITQRNNVASFYTISLILNATTLISFTTNPSEALSDLPFEVCISVVVRSVGGIATGKVISYGDFSVGSLVSRRAMGTETAIDTTIANTLIVQIQANENNIATGPVFVEMGRGLVFDLTP